MSDYIPLTREQTQANIELTCQVGFGHLWLSPQLMEAMGKCQGNFVLVFGSDKNVALRSCDYLKDQFATVTNNAIVVRPHTDGGLIVCNLAGVVGASVGWRTVTRVEDPEHGTLFTFPIEANPQED